MSLRHAAAVLALALAACSDLIPPVGPGTLTATLQGPYASEGAAVVRLLGEGVLEVIAVGDTEVYAFTSDQTTRVVLINPTGGTLAFEVSVADLSRPLVGIVREVAGPDDELRPDPAAYRLEFTR